MHMPGLIAWDLERIPGLSLPVVCKNMAISASLIIRMCEISIISASLILEMCEILIPHDAVYCLFWAGIAGKRMNLLAPIWGEVEASRPPLFDI